MEAGLGGVGIVEGDEQVSLEHRELGVEEVVAADHLERLVDQGQPLLRPTGEGEASRPDGEQERPEDRRRRQPLVQGDAPVHAGGGLPRAPQAGHRDALENEADRPPDRVVVLLGDLEHSVRPLPDELELAAPEVEEADVEERVGERDRVVQLPRQIHGFAGPVDGGRWIADAARGGGPRSCGPRRPSWARGERGPGWCRLGSKRAMARSR